MTNLIGYLGGALGLLLLVIMAGGPLLLDLPARRPRPPVLAPREPRRPETVGVGN